MRLVRFAKNISKTTFVYLLLGGLVFTVAACANFPNTKIYGFKQSPRFNLSDLRYYQSHFPLHIEVYGISASQSETSPASTIKKHLEGHSKIYRTELIASEGMDMSSESNKQKMPDTSLIIALGAATQVAGYEMCKRPTLLKNIKARAQETKTQLAKLTYCRNDRYLGYASMNFDKAVSIESQDFKNAIRLTLSKILTPERRNERCLTRPTLCN
ncbi:MAG: hypothetical protein R3261_08870 [Alphaproteobacteria bacterium]|nr:hypothetical protein [Alphaproteobacteria bacterium]